MERVTQGAGGAVMRSEKVAWARFWGGRLVGWGLGKQADLQNEL